MIPRYYIDNISVPMYYFPQPPYVSSVFSYQDINKDYKLREIVTNYFLNKCIQKFSNLSKNDKSYNIIYNLLRKYVKHNNVNWYDLRELYNNEVIAFLGIKLSSK